MELQMDLLQRTIAMALKKHRDKEDLTQAALAEKASIKRTTVANIERMKQGMTLDILYKVCRVLDIELWDILPPVSSVVSAGTMERAFTIKGRALDEEMPLDLALEITREVERTVKLDGGEVDSTSKLKTGSTPESS